MPKIIHNGVEYGGGGYSKRQIDEKLKLKLSKSSIDTVLSDDSINPVQNKVVTKALNDKISQVKVMPSSDFDGVAVLYTGDTTTEYTQGHVYQYSETDSSWIDITDVLDVIKNVESLPTTNIEDIFYRIGGGEWVTKIVTLSPDPDDTIEQLEAIGYTVLSDHYQESTNTRDVSFKGDNNHFGYVSHSYLYRIGTINATWSLSSGRYAVEGTGNDGHVSIVVLGSERKEDANFKVLAQNELWAGDSETQTIKRVAWNDEVTIQYEIMPTPSENELGKIVQYVGETTGDYIKGFFYRCAEVPNTDPTEYEWVNQEVQESTDTSNAVAEALADTYSTTETKTNKVWIDGKPIYRKVIHYTGVVPSNSAASTVIGSIAGFADIVNFTGTFRNNADGNCFSLNYGYAESDATGLILKQIMPFVIGNEGNVVVARSIGFDITNINIVVEYTKA